MLSRSQLFIICIAMMAVAVANIDRNPVRVEKVPVESTEVIVLKQIVTKEVPAKKPDGYITEENCHQLANGTDFSDVVFRFGWPAGEDGDDSYAGYLTYPLREDHDRICAVNFWDGEVDGVRLDL
jgi:hypothetical protein